MGSRLSQVVSTLRKEDSRHTRMEGGSLNREKLALTPSGREKEPAASLPLARLMAASLAQAADSREGNESSEMVVQCSKSEKVQLMSLSSLSVPYTGRT